MDVKIAKTIDWSDRIDEFLCFLCHSFG
jgi:hypothetical protein